MEKIVLGLFVLLSLLVTTVSNSAPLYKIVNEDGSVTYTDTYQPNAQEIDLTNTNSAVMPSISTPTPSSNRNKKVVKAIPEYKLVLISPEDKQTIRNNSGQMTISAGLSSSSNLSALPSGMYQLIIDGKLEQSQPEPKFAIQNLDRGEHRVQIQLIEQTGKILASTETRVFYLKQASKLINPN